MLIFGFKVQHMALMIVFHILDVKENIPILLDFQNLIVKGKNLNFLEEGFSQFISQRKESQFFRRGFSRFISQRKESQFFGRGSDI
jgi:hypothetical protein